MPVEAATGMSAPDRNICGKIEQRHAHRDAFGSCVMPMKKTPSAPPARARTGASAMTRSRSPKFIGICMTKIIATIPTSETSAAIPDPIELAEQDGVARDRRDEELGREVVLALLDEVRHARDRALVHRVGDHPDEHERQVGERQGAAQVLADAAAEDPDEQDREDHREGDRERALDRPQDLAPGDREHRVDLAAEGRAQAAGDGPGARACAAADAAVGLGVA